MNQQFSTSPLPPEIVSSSTREEIVSALEAASRVMCGTLFQLDRKIGGDAMFAVSIEGSPALVEIKVHGLDSPILTLTLPNGGGSFYTIECIEDCAKVLLEARKADKARKEKAQVKYTEDLPF